MIKFKKLCVCLFLVMTTILLTSCSFGNGGIIRISSGSMEPVLKVGEVYYYQKQDTYELNDIVVIDKNGVMLVHQIVGKYDDSNPQNYLLPGDEGYENSEFWVTKGIASDTLDGILDLSTVKGKIIRKIF